MNKLNRLIICVAAAAALAVAQPTINNFGVQNAASTREGTSNLNLAPGAIFSITGQNLGPFVAAQGDPNNPSPTVGGVMVQVVSGGYSNNAIILSASASEVDAIVPADVPMGPAAFTVTYNNQTGNAVNATIVPASFSAFTSGARNGFSAWNGGGGCVRSRAVDCWRAVSGIT